MTGIADRIMKRVRAKGRGRWVCTPKDFLDLGSRAAVDQALSRLAKSGDLRRVGRGLYDLPRTSGVLNRPAPVDMDKAVAALARRDSIRIMPDGITAANQLGLTNAVPAKTSYVTDGTTRDVKIGNRIVRLRHAGPERDGVGRKILCARGAGAALARPAGSFGCTGRDQTQAEAARCGKEGPRPQQQQPAELGCPHRA